MKILAQNLLILLPLAIFAAPGLAAPPAAAGPQLPTATPTIFAPGVISGPAWDMAPAFTPDGRTVYFTRASPSVSTILVSHLDREEWSRPAIAPFSGAWNDMEPAMSPDGKFLVLVSNRPAERGGKPVDGFFNGRLRVGQGGNLWRIDRQGDSWGPAVRLPDVVNRSGAVFAPSVVRDGAYLPPQPVSWSDGSSTDVDPAVAPDESYAVFGSGRTPAQGMDLFFVCRRNGAWGQPVHMGTDVNSPGSDAEARLSPDGQTLYFASDRVVPAHFPRTPAEAREDLARIDSWDNGNYNIWQVSLAPWLQGECGR